jgi:hypothetical protein
MAGEPRPPDVTQDITRAIYLLLRIDRSKTLDPIRSRRIFRPIARSSLSLVLGGEGRVRGLWARNATTLHVRL